MIFVSVVCIGLAIYCFMNGMYGIGVLALGGMYPSLGFVLLILVTVFLLNQEHYVAAVLPPLLIAWNLVGLYWLNKKTD